MGLVTGQGIRMVRAAHLLDADQGVGAAGAVGRRIGPEVDLDRAGGEAVADHVVAVAAVDDVVTAATTDQVVAAIAANQVVAVIAGQDVVVDRAGNVFEIGKRIDVAPAIDTLVGRDVEAESAPRCRMSPSTTG